METSRSESLYCLSDHCQACPLLTEIPSVWTVVFKPPVIVAAGQQLSVWCLGCGQSHTSPPHLTTTASLQRERDWHQTSRESDHTEGHWGTSTGEQGGVLTQSRYFLFFFKTCFVFSSIYLISTKLPHGREVRIIERKIRYGRNTLLSLAA